MNEKVDLAVVPTGVPGLDVVLGGGLPELSFNIIGGAPGSGKTTFAQQIMFSLANENRKALFFTAMGEPPIKMLRYQQQFGFFDFDKVDTSVKFINLAAEVEAGNYDAVLAQIASDVRTHAPALVFIDSFRSFVNGTRGDNQDVRALQRFVQQLVTQMTGWHATTFLIGEYLENEADQNPIFTVADGIIWLNQHVYRNAMVRKMQVLKQRGLKHRPGLHTFRIERNGIEIFPRIIGAREPVGAAPRRGLSKGRISTGIPVLDTMLGGGVPIGYSLLMLGPTGSGKTMMATEFLAECVREGETAVLALFEKSPGQMMSEKLDNLVATGLVDVLDARKLDLSVDETLSELLARIDRTGAKRVVLDSLSGFEVALAAEFRDEFRESLYRMTTILSEKGVTVLMTCELQDNFSELRFGAYGQAFLVDSIVMQRYIEANAQLKTVISVVKVRGSAHSRDFREFEITDEGIVIGEGPAPYQNILNGGRST